MDEVNAIILDLRSNGGGLLDQAVDVASIFIPEGEVIVSTEGLHSAKQVYKATGDAYPDIPLYVLTDPYTASASEIVSGALQDYGRATLVGETTFGKGLVQSIEPLSNGGALKATTAIYLTPKGRDINNKGIAPDVVAPDDPATTGVDETVEATLKLITGEYPSLDDVLHDAHLHAQPRSHPLDDHFDRRFPACPVSVLASSFRRSLRQAAGPGGAGSPCPSTPWMPRTRTMPSGCCGCGRATSAR